MLNIVATCWNVVATCWILIQLLLSNNNILARSWNGGRGNVAVALRFERCRRYHEAATKKTQSMKKRNQGDSRQHEKLARIYSLVVPSFAAISASALSLMSRFLWSFDVIAYRHGKVSYRLISWLVLSKLHSNSNSADSNSSAAMLILPRNHVTPNSKNDLFKPFNNVQQLSTCWTADFNVQHHMIHCQHLLNSGYNICCSTNVEPCIIGFRSAPYIFTCIADLLEWVAKQNYNVTFLMHYLDDFHTLGPPGSSVRQTNLDRSIDCFSKLGVPLHPDKIEGASTCLTNLSIKLDSLTLQAHLPQDKLDRITALLEVWSQKRWCRRNDLESLIAHLQHACKVVPQGRSFLSRMMNLLCAFRRHEMGAVFYLGAGWPQWKPLGIPGTLLPLKRGSWLNLVKCNLTKLTTTSLAVKRSTSLAVKRFTNLAVKRFTSLAVKRFTSLAVKRFTSLAVKRFTSLAVKQSSNLAVKQFVSLAVKQFRSLVLKRPTSSAGIQQSIP